MAQEKLAGIESPSESEVTIDEYTPEPEADESEGLADEREPDWLGESL